MKEKSFMKLINVVVTVSTGILFSLLLMQMYYTGNIGYDDWEHWATSWFMYHGYLPYRDFFQHHNPLLWYLEMPFFSFVDHPWEVFEMGRLMAAVFFFGGCFFIGKILQALGGTAVSFLYALFVYLSYPVVTGSYIQNRPDTQMIFCLLAGLYYWIRFYQGKKERDLVICYFLFFLAFAFLQKAVWLFVPFGIYQLYLLIKKEMKWSSVFRACLLPFLIILGYGIYLYMTGSLVRYWELNWVLNFHYFRDYQAYSYDILDHAYNFLCPCFLFWGILKGKGLVRHLSFLLLGLGFIYFCVPKPYPYYWLIWVPFAALAFGFGMEKMLKSSLFLARFFVMAFLLFSCFLSDVYMFTDKQVVKHIPVERINRNLAKHFKAGDEIIDYDTYLAFFFRTYPPHYYWYNLMRGALWDIHLFHRHELPDWDGYIYKNKPKYVIHHEVYDLMRTDDNNTDHKIMGVPEEWLKEHYRYLDDCDVYERLDKDGVQK